MSASRVLGMFAAMLVVIAIWAATPLEWIAAQQSATVGVFEGSGDVGTVVHAGTAAFATGSGKYTLTGSGDNMWFGKDEFQFVWKKMSGSVSIAADISFPAEGKNEHRKAVLMVRQSLDEDSVYADAALHGDGLASLQFREVKGAETHEVRTTISAPKKLKLVKHGNYFTMWVAGEDGRFMLASASPKIALTEPFYVGIGVCSHEKDLVEKAEFSNVDVKAAPAVAAKEIAPQLYSLMERIDVESGDRTAIYVAEGKFEAPNWMPDGKRLLFNRDGKIETLAVSGGPATQTIDTGSAVHCNNDHGISPDGKELVVSDQSRNADHKSQLYILPVGGGPAREVTRNAPSYWHGWSPDGKTLAFVGERGGEFDIYTIAATGGDEKRLTTAKGLDDGPEYTPDGKYIYFNSERTGHMQIWRMKADGSEQEQVTFGDGNDWFPHFSPDGKQMVFITFEPGVQGHPPNKDVELRMMTMADKKIHTVARLFGGQGTMNVPSWSPDGKQFAFVSYALVGE